MSTRGRRKQTGPSRVPINQNVDQPPDVAGSVRTKKTKAKAKVPAARKSKVVATPVKNRAPPRKNPTRVPKFGTAANLNDESDSSQLLEDPELSVIESESEDDSRLKI